MTTRQRSASHHRQDTDNRGFYQTSRSAATRLRTMPWKSAAMASFAHLGGPASLLFRGQAQQLGPSDQRQLT